MISVEGKIWYVMRNKVLEISEGHILDTIDLHDEEDFLDEVIRNEERFDFDLY